jgi:hypothetical protein
MYPFSSNRSQFFFVVMGASLWNIEHSHENAIGPLGQNGDWNDIFLVVHPGVV